MIESYDFGSIVIEGKKYTADLIVLPDRINSSWWRKEGHVLGLDDLSDVLREDIEVLVIGTGFFGLMKVSDDLKQSISAKGIVLFIEKTKRAVRVFNEQVPRKKTAGAFHLTC